MNINERINKIVVTPGKAIPLGATVTKTGVNFSVEVTDGKELSLIIYKKNSTDILKEIKFTEDMKFGKVYSMNVQNFDIRYYDYGYILDGEKYFDAYAKIVNGNQVFGKSWDVKRKVDENNSYKYVRTFDNTEKSVITYSVYSDSYNWEDDVKVSYDFSDMIIYRIHPRSFTMDKSAKVRNNGTFSGIVEKIPYMKQLGITSIELMPSYDFDENSQKINFFGYTDGHYFAPKSAYSKKTGKYAVDEFKNMVKELHKNGIEVIMEFYFTENIVPNMICECLRYWVLEYHINGIRVNLDAADVKMLKSDAVLWDTKIIGDRWDIIDTYPKGNPEYGQKRHLAVCHDGFMVTARRFIKSDENQIYDIVTRLKDNNEIGSIINYLANHNSFSVMDMVSFERKHNESNGEANEDGAEYNYSWNCGTEGPTRKRKIQELRRKQIKNAFTLLLLAQGTPMIFAGDEMCHTRMGNNNAYCQDNEINYINWNMKKMGNEINQYVKKLIEFRKAHKIIHMENVMKMIDMKNDGCPDLSVHGILPWRVDYHHVNRTFAFLYNEKYSEIADDSGMIYIAFNMYWESQEFNIPLSDRTYEWKVEFATDDLAKETIEVKNNRTVEVPPRCIVVLTARKKCEIMAKGPKAIKKLR